MTPLPIVLVALLAGQPEHSGLSPLRPLFVDATAGSGLDRDGVPPAAARVAAADFDDDGYPDAVIGRDRVFMNRTAEAGRLAFRPVDRTGLPDLRPRDVIAFADLDNDGLADAVVGRNFDPGDEATAPPLRSGWLKGNGDGTFGAFNAFPVEPSAVACIAVHDANRDGLPDVALGNWYTAYGQGYDAAPTHLLLQRPGGGFERAPMPDDGVAFGEADTGGRPTYGILLANLLDDGRVGVLELNYGRRANRFIVPEDGVWIDLAPRLGIDGDAVRHGEYPQWVRDRGRSDEKPFRSHGNTFDAAIADANGDGLPDLYLATIAHAWAGESSDRSRLLLRDGARFVHDPAWSTDRIPADRTDWNQGDLFAAFIDADLDARPDLLLSSGDYPDPEPFAQRLRLYRNTGAGFTDLTQPPYGPPVLGFDHRGSAQLAVADFDRDGDADVLVGQSFMRLDADLRAEVAYPEARTPEGGPAPSVRLLLNRAVEHGGRSIALRLDGAGPVSRWAYGAIVRATMDHDGDPETPAITTTHWLNPVGGHAGKCHGRAVIIGLGEAPTAGVVVTWPDGTDQILGTLEPGAHRVAMP